MSGVSKGSLGLCSVNNEVLPGSVANDFLMYVTSSNQRMLFGTSNIMTSMIINGTGDITLSNKVFTNNAFLGNALTDSVNAPTYTWNNDSNTGMYHDSNQIIGFSVGGVNALKVEPGTISTSNANFNLYGNSRYITLEATNNSGEGRVGGIIIRNHWAREKGLYFEDNDATRSNGYWQIGAKYSGGAVNTKLGIYKDTSNIMEFGTLGNVGIGAVPSSSYKLDVSGIMRTTGYYVTATDSVTSPGYSWDGDATTGLYHDSSGIMGLSCLGTETMKIEYGSISSSNANLSLHGADRSILIEGSNTSSLTFKNYWSRERGIYFENMDLTASNQTWHLGQKYNGGISMCNLGFYYGTSNIIEYNTLGNVGIGKTPTGFKLDVNGIMACRGFTLYQVQS